jgi:DNA-binding NtrC family response regulator
MASLRILIVDDDPSTCLFLKSAFSSLRHECATALTFEEGREYAVAHPVDLVMLDVYLGSANGLDLVPRFRSLNPNCYCVIMTAHISVETAARSVSEGAIEYVSKPLLLADVEGIAQRATEFLDQSRVVRPAAPASTSPASSIVGSSPRMLEVYRAIARVAPSNAHVLITGPSGSGKELVARAIHEHSRRRDNPFTAVNCGSLTETILEAELFGHEKGSFTGADKARTGLVESSDGGTLFLDEITETTLGFQVKLLRFIQEQQVRRIGANKYTAVDVRIVAASNRDFQDLIASGRFREDLFYRLSVVQIAVPSLDERREDIPALVEHFLAQFNIRNGSGVAIEEAAVRKLGTMNWPGNVRELENCVHRLAIFAASGLITPTDVDRVATTRTMPADPLGIPHQAAAPEPAYDRLTDLERDHIQRVLQDSGGNRSEAARRLGIERKTLYKKARRLGIDLPLQGGR